MAIIRLGPQNFENYELVARPLKTFRSSSSGILSGSVLLMKDASPSLKDLSRKNFGTINEAVAIYDDENGAHRLEDMHLAGGESVEEMMNIINKVPTGLRYTKRQEVLRVTPGAALDKNFFKKNVIRRNLFPHYRSMYPSMEWAFTNYNCLNFYEDTNVPTDSVLIYPASTSSSDTENFYAPSGSFTFDFYVKPKTNSDSITRTSEISPGTILHMSSCYAISLITGSSRDPLGLPDKYRIMLQLSSSANIKPDFCKITGSGDVVTSSLNPGRQQYLFASTDNSLIRDQWNHVAIRWPGAISENGSGSFVINGSVDSYFNVTDDSIMQFTSSEAGVDDPNALFVGNYYNGTNAGNQSISLFFNNPNSQNYGVANIINSDTVISGTAQTRFFSNHMRGELHDIKIFNTFKNLVDIRKNKEKGQSLPLQKDLLFYVPPYFVKETKTRKFLRTPFIEDTGSSSTPFNPFLSFGLSGLEINLENYTREFVKNQYPLLWNLTSSAINTSVYEESLTANDLIYSKGSARKRLRTVLPCDNGYFKPDYSMLTTGSAGMSAFVDSFGNRRVELISLDDMIGEIESQDTYSHNVISFANYPGGLRAAQEARRDPVTGDIIDQWSSIQDSIYDNVVLQELEGATPENPTANPGAVLTVLQRTGDTSSSEVVMFDISNMFYGDSITPSSVVLEDLQPTGSNGSLTFKLRDNGQGSLYRYDVNEDQPHAHWSSVGNVIYEEGLIVIKSPNLGFFGKEDFRLTFKGEKSVYVFEVSVPVESALHNSSSNPTYTHLKPTDYSNEIAQRFNYITGISLHDDNLNVVGKASLSQPFMKREDDRVVIKLRMDF